MDNGLYYRYSGRLLMSMEYNMMRVSYDENLDKDMKLRFIFAQYADTINQLRSEITDISRDINLDPQQLENIFTFLGATCLKYIYKNRGISIKQAFDELLEDQKLAEKLRDLDKIYDEMEDDEDEE